MSYSHSGLIALLHRLDFDYRKPERVPRALDDAKQQAFIDEYENLLNTMGVDEAINLRPPPASGLMPPILGRAVHGGMHTKARGRSP